MDLTNWTILFACGTALAGIGTGLYLMFWVMRLSPGSDRMQQIALAIQEGAKAYLNRQYRTVGVVAVVLFILLWAAGSISDRFGLLSAIGFLVGASASATAGYIGMLLAVRANVRTTQAAHGGLNAALQVAFRGGAVTGLLLIGLGLLAVAGFYRIAISVTTPDRAFSALLSLGFGSSLISVFARV
ncbi:MAG TPA: sodium/proton-translocating pyrophosphatase, partial [Nitrospiria bacterium]|nr:sodium/proton-translocating pyrophosphatase [Nitrospiria bacterium]